MDPERFSKLPPHEEERFLDISAILWSWLVALCVVCMYLLGLVINDLCVKKPGGSALPYQPRQLCMLKPLMRTQEIGAVRRGGNRIEIRSICLCKSYFIIPIS